jgi:DeoR family ulaG and ulaABCDEF operon transcriptional repressor
VSVPVGAIFREQNIILSPFDDDGSSRYHASKLFMGAAAIGAKGIMQADAVLIQAERRLLGKADQSIVLVDSSKFLASASFVVCGLDDIDIVITDGGARDTDVAMLKAHDIQVVIAR